MPSFQDTVGSSSTAPCLGGADSATLDIRPRRRFRLSCRKESFVLKTAMFLFCAAFAGAEIRTNYEVAQPAAGDLRFKWIYGSVCNALNRDPRVQVVMYNEDTYVMRQNIAVHHSAPFTYLLMGNSGALLIDTGATAEARYYPLRATVDALLKHWGDLRGKADLPLTVVLTSGENLYQNQGYAQFRGRPNTRLVPPDAAEIDLGGRVVTVIPTPGTHKDGVSFYDRYDGFLFTGDFVCPGRITIANDVDYLKSIARLRAFRDSHPVKWVMGGQIDMQFLPGVEYMRLITYKPMEHVLQLDPAVLDDAAATAERLKGKADVIIRAEFAMRNRVGPDFRKPGTREADLPPVPVVGMLR